MIAVLVYVAPDAKEIAQQAIIGRLARGGVTLPEADFAMVTDRPTIADALEEARLEANDATAVMVLLARPE
jgi:hypothetical protein